MNKINRYTEKINQIIGCIDFKKLEASYNTRDREYAVEVLNRLHEAFIEVYGSSYVGTNTADDSDGVIFVPGIILVPKTGKVLLGILELDLRSSGEHWNTYFFTKYGAISQSSDSLSSREKEYIESLIPYTYFYTPYISGDIHTHRKVPKPVKKMLSQISTDNSWAV